MNHNIIDVINLLGKSSKLYSIGKVEPSKIEEASKMLDVDFAEEFMEYTQEYGAISVAGIELCGVVNSKNHQRLFEHKKCVNCFQISRWIVM